MNITNEELDKRYLKLSEVQKIEFMRLYKEAIARTHNILNTKKLIKLTNDTLRQQTKSYKHQQLFFVILIVVLSVLDLIMTKDFVSNYLYLFLLAVFMIYSNLMGLVVLPKLMYQKEKLSLKLDEINSSGFSAKIDVNDENEFLDKVIDYGYYIDELIGEENDLKLRNTILKYLENIETFNINL